MVAAAAASFGEIDNIVMIDSGSGNGDSTLERFSTTIPTALGTAMSVLKSFGLDGLLTSLAGTGSTPVDSGTAKEAIASAIRETLSDPEFRREIPSAASEIQEEPAESA